MSTTAENNKRIAKNTLLLYIRMIFSIIIGLYTSRIILKLLGFEDYGIYNIAGSIITSFTFINTALTAASQRFITFELGTGNINKLNRVFCTSVTIHYLIALLIFILAETIGLWFLNTHINIDPNRLYAANWVYQCSIISFMISIISVPYNACIVAHEHMKAFAYISIIEKLLILIAVEFLYVINADKLIAYAIFILCISLIIRICYVTYCNYNFIECKYKFFIDKKFFKEIFSFSGWSIIGNLGFTFKDQIGNIIINIFFGTIVNAARGIAMQLYGIITNFSANFLMAINPQITKCYASGNIKDSVRLVYIGSKYGFSLLLLISVPIIINTEYLFQIWLGKVPQYSSIFLQLSLVAALINTMAQPLVVAIQATGKIRTFQIVICIIMLCELPSAYFIYLNGGEPYMIMYPTIILTMIGLLARLIIIKKLVPDYNFHYFIFSIIAKNLFVGVLCIISAQYMRTFFNNSIYSFIITSFISCCIVIFMEYVIGLTPNERKYIKEIISNRIIKHTTNKISQ